MHRVSGTHRTEVGGYVRPGGALNFTFGDTTPLRVHVDAATPDLVTWTGLLTPPTDAGAGLLRQLRRSWDYFLLSSLRSYVDAGVDHPRESAADLAWRGARRRDHAALRPAAGAVRLGPQWNRDRHSALSKAPASRYAPQPMSSFPGESAVAQ